MKTKNVIQQTDKDSTAAREDLHKAKAVVSQLFKNEISSEQKAVISGMVYAGMMLNRIASRLELLILHTEQQKEDDTDEQRGA